MPARLGAIAARAHVAPTAGVCLALVEEQPQTFLVGATADPMARRPEHQVGGRPQHWCYCIADRVSRSRNAPGERALHRNKVAALRTARQCGAEDEEVASVKGFDRTNCTENSE